MSARDVKDADSQISADRHEMRQKNLFARLAIDDPQRLIAMISDASLASHELTFAAEEAGSIADGAARPALLALLDHVDPVVREGAIYGLSRMDQTPATVEALQRIAKHDPSRGVRDAANEVL